MIAVKQLPCKMARQLQNLIGEAAIIQGEDWNLRKFYAIVFPGGDWSDWTPFGQLWSGLEENGGVLLTTLEWGETFWDSATDYTYFYPLIPSDVTTTLPPTTYQGHNTLSVKSAYPFDMTISKDGRVQSASYGLAQVIRRISHA